jgi:hypothetical protein
MMGLLADTPIFWKGVVVVACGLILFVGSIYVLLSCVFGLRMGYLVLAVCFFGWMILLSMLWVTGQPKFLGVTGTLANLGPRGTERHWQVYAAATGPETSSRFPVTSAYPGAPWHQPNDVEKPSLASVTSAMQKYLAQQAEQQFAAKGQKICTPTSAPTATCLTVDPTTFLVQDIEFARSNGTSVAAAHSFFTLGGPEITLYVYRDKGNVNVYSWSFFLASIVGFAIHVPLLDRAEKKRKEILTGGTAPPWYGPA